MTGAARRGPRNEVSEEAAAGARVVLCTTLAVGAMAAGIDAANGASLPVVGAPALLLAASLAWLAATERGRDRAVTLAGSAGVGVWLVLLPAAHDEAYLAPLSMIVLCLAVALRPERLLAWIGRDLGGRPAPEPPVAEGWIEER